MRRCLFTRQFRSCRLPMVQRTSGLLKLLTISELDNMRSQANELVDQTWSKDFAVIALEVFIRLALMSVDIMWVQVETLI